MHETLNSKARCGGSGANLKYQRQSNFRPLLTDEELVTIYLSSHMQGFYQQRRTYDYTRRHWRAWLPTLPCYQAV